MSVYFIQAGIGGRIKIGFSPRPKQRIAYLGRFNGPDIITLAVIEGSRGVEYALHQHLAAHRAHDEWFEPTAQVLDVVLRAVGLPQDDGFLHDLNYSNFSISELSELVLRPGIIGKVARTVVSQEVPYYHEVLAALIRLLDGEP